MSQQLFMSTPLNISTSDKYALAAALLECDCMKDVGSRNQVVNDLPGEISVNIIRFPGAKQDVVSIVDACLKHAGGIQSLMDVVRFFEDGSKHWQLLIELQARIFTPSLESLGERLAELS